ncbi:MAG: glycine C-acetyltransferase [Elusimicrobia bacterium]|nr:glycine C-acetyltransferase [Elusimicrobiota bacterium]
MEKLEVCPGHPSLKFLERDIQVLKDQNRYIRLRLLESAQEPVSLVDGKRVVNLTSNNYLALANHPALKAAAIGATQTYGVGSAAVRTIIGSMTLHAKLEQRLAEFKGTEAALVLQSGFATNVAVCQCLMSGETDLLVSDALNHASIIDGARLAKSERKIYPHKDMAALRKILESPQARKARRKMIVTDGVFSMDGDLAPLPEIVDLADRYGAVVMVDDAHASGVMGRNGRGTVDHFRLHGKVAIQIGTLSKAIAALGGYVASSGLLREYMICTARPFLFSSSHPPSVAATCIAALDILENEPERIARLWDNTGFFKEGLKKLGFDTGRSETPITPVMVGDTQKAKSFSEALFEEGVFALWIGYPTVPKGQERLRAIVTSGHAQEDLEFALRKFQKTGKALGLI